MGSTISGGGEGEFAGELSGEEGADDNGLLSEEDKGDDRPESVEVSRAESMVAEWEGAGRVGRWRGSGESMATSRQSHVPATIGARVRG